MTRHEAQALVIGAVGDLPQVARIDYVVDAAGEGVVVRTSDGWCLALLHTTLEGMTVGEYRQVFVQAEASAQRQREARGGSG